MPRGPMFVAGKAGKGKSHGPSGDACEHCSGGNPNAPCTCVVQDRCSETSERGHQCILGAGHTMRHVTAAGKHFE